MAGGRLSNEHRKGVRNGSLAVDLPSFWFGMKKLWKSSLTTAGSALKLVSQLLRLATACAVGISCRRAPGESSTATPLGLMTLGIAMRRLKLQDSKPTKIGLKELQQPTPQ